MFISVFSPKGGVGTSAVSALFAKALSSFGQTYLIESSRGDLEAMLGLDTFARYGFLDWVTSPAPTAESLGKISVEHSSNLSLVAGVVAKKPSETDKVGEIDSQQNILELEPNGSQINISVEALLNLESHCVVDCSLGDSQLQKAILKASDIIVLTVRQCYLSLFRSTHHDLIEDVDVVAVICENGRTISPKQIAQTLDKKFLIELDARRDFARIIDAGTLWGRTPSALLSPIENYIHDLLCSISDKPLPQIPETSGSFDRNHFDFWGEKETDVTSSSKGFTTHAKMLLEQRLK